MLIHFGFYFWLSQRLDRQRLRCKVPRRMRFSQGWWAYNVRSRTDCPGQSTCIVKTCVEERKATCRLATIIPTVSTAVCLINKLSCAKPEFSVDTTGSRNASSRGAPNRPQLLKNPHGDCSIGETLFRCILLELGMMATRCCCILCIP